MRPGGGHPAREPQQRSFGSTSLRGPDLLRMTGERRTGWPCWWFRGYGDSDVQRPGRFARDAAPQAALVAAVLPLSWSGLRRADGAVMVALSRIDSGDASRDALRGAAQPPLTRKSVCRCQPPLATAATPTLCTMCWIQDRRRSGSPCTGVSTSGFRTSASSMTPVREESLRRRASAAAIPTTEMESVPSAYWCQVGERTYSFAGCCSTTGMQPPTRFCPFAGGVGHLSGRGNRGLLEAFRACAKAPTGTFPVWELDASTRLRRLRKRAQRRKLAGLSTMR